MRSGVAQFDHGCEDAINFTWEDIGYKVLLDDARKSEKCLVAPTTGTAIGGRLLAIMGPSGAGKTTLMNATTGRLQRDKKHVQQGRVLLNDTLFTEKYKKLVSVVTQEDAVMGKETPRDAFYFSCRVRLGLSHEEALARTEQTIYRLHLTSCANTLLGIPGLIKGVSGGEKKRTNIGSELITNPYVLLLDEPTTGLDSVNALRVAQLLHSLAHDAKHTVVCTIHAPSSELFHVFDDLMLLARGHVIYHGPAQEAPAYFASLGFKVPPRTNPSEHYMHLMQRPDDDGVVDMMIDAWEKYLTSPEAQQNPCVGPAPASLFESNIMLDERAKEKGASVLIQFSMLWRRSVRMYLRDPAATFGRLMQTLFFAIFIGLFFFKVSSDAQGVQDRAGALLVLMINNILLSAMTGLNIFPPERSVFLHEQAAETYNPHVYFIAKMIAELPFQIGFPTLFTCIVYFMIGLAHSAEAFFIFLMFCILLSNLGSAFGIFAGAFFKSTDVAFAVVPLIFFPLTIVAGFFANTSRLDPYFTWLCYLSFPRFAYIGLFLNEFSHVDNLCPNNAPTCQFKDGATVIKVFGFDKTYSWWLCAVCLLIFYLGFCVLGSVSLAAVGRARQGRLEFQRRTVAAAVEMKEPLH